MKAQDLSLIELVNFAEGRLSLHDRRLVLHSIHAFAQLRRDLIDNSGIETARRIFTRFGLFWGQADAAAMKRIFTWDSPEEWLKAGPRMMTLQGAAQVTIGALELDAAAGRFLMEVDWRDSGEAEEHLAEIGKSGEPACWILAGYASGYASFCLGRDVYFVEQKCRARGDLTCAAIGRDRESWGPGLKAHLPYFQSGEIRGKVEQLSRELKARTRELAAQRDRISELEGARHPSFVEVHSKSYQRVLDVAVRVARFDTSILLTGETGTGKEVLARHIHRLSERSSGPFQAINCGALPETLLESELFGHKAGSFTGATHDRTGLFEQAKSGTVFLDEIGDVSPALQLKLLRVLQEKEITRVGENQPRKIDVRVMAATNRDLNRAVADGKFREDLLYRLRVIEIVVPPLRERREDILPLARNFVTAFAKKLKLPDLRLDSTCVDRLQSYDWPGNVRELENSLERAAVLSPDQVIRPEAMPAAIVAASSKTGAADQSPVTLAEAENRHIRRILDAAGGNRTRAAKILGISQTTMWRKLGKRKTGE
jgi:DNA-binding NtrC family response regulator/predicted hydrocarbon binding protein